MFYRLKKEYVLRGWEGLAWVLVKQPENQIERLSQEVFQTLLLCDGETELPGGLLDDAMEKALKEYMGKGVVEPCEEFRPLEQEQYYKYYHNRYVNCIFWSITGRCNYRCRHCYMDAPCSAMGELSTRQCLNFIDQMAECGVLRVDLTGGEPFVRKDFWQLVDYILSHHIVIGIVYTNGWLVNDKLLDEFEKRGCKPEFSISFDGVGWHDWMRGIPGAEQAALRALKLLYDRGFVTDVEMCIHKGNIDSIPQTIMALKAVGCEDVKLSNVAETDLWKSNNESLGFSNKEYIQAVIPYIAWYYKEGRPIKKFTLSNVAVLYQNADYHIVAAPYDGTEKCLNCYMCGAARMSCYITPEGRLLPCMPMIASPQQEKFPLVQDIGLKQGLSDSYYMQFVNGRIRDLLAENAECNACQYRYKCGGGCRATALLDGNRQLMGCDRTMCLLWKDGYVDRIRQVADEAVAKYGAAQNTL